MNFRNMLAKSWRVLWSFISITAVTLLIWLYAEGENIRRYDLSMEIALVGPTSRQLVIEPARRSVQVAFTSAADQVAQFRKLIEEPLRLEVSEDPEQPTQIIVLRDRLASDPRLANLGISILDVQPSTLPVRVESLVTVTLPVKVTPPPAEMAQEVTIDPVAEPAQATVLLPSSRARQATGQTAFEVSLDPQRLAGLTPGIVNRLAVPLSLPEVFRQSQDANHVRIEPSTVNVSVTVRTLTAELALPAVPIKLVVSPNDLRVYEPPVLGDDHVRNLVLRGPQDVIRDIQQGRVQIYAELRLNADELENASRSTEGASKLPVINTPPGVSVSNLTTPVRFLVTRKP